jgi:hypothetical protein
MRAKPTCFAKEKETVEMEIKIRFAQTTTKQITQQKKTE